MSAADAQPVTIAEARTLFAPFADQKVIVIAVSGGPDSTALLWLAARWRDSLARPPKLIAITVDHGLRQESAREARAVKTFAGELGIEHRTLRWRGAKPRTGIQEAARHARYRLLADAARRAGAAMVVTAHTLDDQAETVLLRLLRGSGPAGLQAMSEYAPYPNEASLSLARPFLTVPKARLLASLRKAAIPFADDASNRDWRYTRPRLREIMPALAAEGLTAERLATLARRLRRADIAIRQAVEAAAAQVVRAPKSAPSGSGRIVFDRNAFAALPAEIALRLLGEAIAGTGDEGPVELGKLETLFEALTQVPAGSVFRRTLAGAMVTAQRAELAIERAPQRRARPGGPVGRRITALTTRKAGAVGTAGKR